MVGVAARSAWVVGAGLVLALACGGKAESDDLFDEPAAGGEAGEATGARPAATGGATGVSGGATGVTGGAPVGSGGISAAAGETAAGEPGGDGGAAGAPNPSVCGNGIVEEPEECDDRNASNVDLCTNQCRAARCGDGYVQPGEECDGPDSRDTPGDCNEFCLRYTLPTCGDARVDPGEECDDGNQSETDACSNECRLAVCGDGVRQVGEQCDDGNGNNNDDCLNTCKAPTCGDGILHNLGSGREVCDEGEDNGPFPANCTDACTLGACGNGELDPSEECDDGEANSIVSSCLPNCAWNVCGDGYAYLEETPGTGSPESLHPCDDLNDDFSDACTDACEWAVCGDGKLYVRGYDEESYGSSADGNPSEDNAAALEECDDGNDLSGDGCDAECVVEINF
jgi:cysteine-rich repeat protein